MIGIIWSVPTYLLDDQCNAAVRARIRPERDPDVVFIISWVCVASLSSAPTDERCLKRLFGPQLQKIT
jgi:hypothetical protein